jgi:hypothetical protein
MALCPVKSTPTNALTVKAAMNPAELRLWEKNSTIVIFLAILSKSFILLSLA